MRSKGRKPRATKKYPEKVHVELSILKKELERIIAGANGNLTIAEYCVIISANATLMKWRATSWNPVRSALIALRRNVRYHKLAIDLNPMIRCVQNLFILRDVVKETSGLGRGKTTEVNI